MDDIDIDFYAYHLVAMYHLKYSKESSTKPLEIFLEYFVWQDDIMLYGAGDTESKAIQDHDVKLVIPPEKMSRTLHLSEYK